MHDMDEIFWEENETLNRNQTLKIKNSISNIENIEEIIQQTFVKPEERISQANDKLLEITVQKRN